MTAPWNSPREPDRDQSSTGILCSNRRTRSSGYAISPRIPRLATHVVTAPAGIPAPARIPSPPANTPAVSTARVNAGSRTAPSTIHRRPHVTFERLLLLPRFGSTREASRRDAGRRSPRGQVCNHSASKSVRRLNSASRSLTSSFLRPSNRPNPKSSTAKDASALPAMIARLTLTSLKSSTEAR